MDALPARAKSKNPKFWFLNMLSTVSCVRICCLVFDRGVACFTAGESDGTIVLQQKQTTVSCTVILYDDTN